MVAMGPTEVLAWALIAAGSGYAAVLTRGVAAATVTAALAALAVRRCCSI